MEKRIFKAIKENNIEDIKKYIEQGKNLDMLNDDGNTPIMEALSNKQLKIAQLLYNAGSVLNIKNLNGETAYELASRFPLGGELAEKIREDSIISANFGNRPIGYTKHKIGYKLTNTFDRQNEAFKTQILSREMVDTSEIKYYIEYYGRPLTLYIYSAYNDDFAYCGGGLAFDYYRKISLKEQEKLKKIILEYEKRFIITEPPYYMVLVQE